MSINEEFLSFLWQFRLFTQSGLCCVGGEELRIIHPGWLNTHAGPDFLQATLEIAGTTWIGNVEIHVKASDWYLHTHDSDKKYDSVILHVVYEYDKPIFRENRSEIPALQLKNSIDSRYKDNYQQLISARSLFPCAPQILEVDPLTITGTLVRMLSDRLERKSTEVLEQLKYYQGDWEATLYHFLARSFGFKVNAIPFELLAGSLKHSILAKHHQNAFQIESLLFGQAGFLEDNFAEDYPARLQNEYRFLKKKWKLKSLDVSLWKFLRMRPASFPTVRIAQFAALMSKSPVFFSELMHCHDVRELQRLFDTLTIPVYWQSHYTFNKESPNAHTHMGIFSVNSILINAFCVVLFSYGRHTANTEFKSRAIRFLEAMAPESNYLVDSYRERGVLIENAFDSQAILELNKSYCSQKKCLNCGIGVKLLKR
ncbi:MAG: DUF2851 family protein [Pedobacter sp.]|nr:MAG: DUF2851 family protein [Pedobacter sp.]